MYLLLIDNEPEVRGVLRTMVENWNQGRFQIAEADGVASGLEMVRTLNPSIVLLDVEMDDGTGFDLLEKLPHPTFQLIFTTAHNQYAIQAFRCSALDYLLKPVDPLELAQSLDRALGQLTQQTLQQQLEVLMRQLKNEKEAEKQIVLKDIDKTYFVRISDILYCEAAGSYTKFHLVDAGPIFVSRNLRSYEELLSPYGFFRTHHSCLVNPNKIKLYDRKADSGMLLLEGGKSIPVSQRKKDMVLHLLEKR